MDPPDFDSKIGSETSTPAKNEPEDEPKEASTLIDQQKVDEPTRSELEFIINQLNGIQQQINNSRPTTLQLLFVGHTVGFASAFFVTIGLIFNGPRAVVFSIIGLLCSTLCLATTFGKLYYRRQKMREVEKYTFGAAKIDAKSVAGDLHNLIFVDDFRVKIENSINVILLILRTIVLFFLIQIPVEYLRYHLIGEVLIGLTVFECVLDVVGIKMSYTVFFLSNDPVTHVGERMGCFIELLRKDDGNKNPQMDDHEIKAIISIISFFNRLFMMNKTLTYNFLENTIITFHETLENEKSIWKTYVESSIEKMEDAEVARNVDITEETIFTALPDVLSNVATITAKTSNLSEAVENANSHLQPFSMNTKTEWLEFLELNKCCLADNNQAEERISLRSKHEVIPMF